MNRKIIRKLRAQRDLRELDRALRTASPSMRQELMAAASRDMHLL
ncbi:hypothetical protein [Jatrophihabitans sp.]|nr:hypothetical protein [Jatrophihabitans sp.]